MRGAKYKIVGSDGTVYGPVERETLMRWVKEGRVTATTTLIDDATGRTFVAAELAALAGKFAPPIAAPPETETEPGPESETEAPAPPVIESFQEAGQAEYVSPEAPPTQATAAPATGDRSFLTVILLWFFLGGFGVYRMYLKRVWSGLAMPFLLFSAAVTGFFYPPGLFIIAIPVWIWGHLDMILILTGVLKVRGKVVLVGITGGLKALGWVFFSLNFVFSVFLWIYNFSVLAEQQGKSPWSVIQSNKPYYDDFDDSYLDEVKEAYPVPVEETESGMEADELDDGGDEAIALPELLPFVVPDFPGGVTLVVSGYANVREDVAAEGYAVYSSIQGAIDAAAAGDTVFVDEGTYYESLVFESLDDLRIIGRGFVLIVARVYENVVTIFDCNNLVFEKLSMRHEISTEASSQNVISIYGFSYGSRNILFTQCDISGSAMIGVMVDLHGSGIRIESSKIHGFEIGIYDSGGQAVTTVSTDIYSNQQFDYATDLDSDDIDWYPSEAVWPLGDRPYSGACSQWSNVLARRSSITVADCRSLMLRTRERFASIVNPTSLFFDMYARSSFAGRRANFTWPMQSAVAERGPASTSATSPITEPGPQSPILSPMSV